jgi:circadian clock protein KaiB
MTRIELILYVTGDGPAARQAAADAQRLCADHLQQAELTVIDTAARPERAAADHVRLTPTLVRKRPPPERRVVGNLADGPKVLAALGLREEAQPSPPSAPQAP